ncbi:MAG: hypothetical protein M1833_004969 [Piccolia ochrophora]|nr:MAG: hypothetical protein M1833_004969 [Piccolia ochrophora]
MAALTSEHVKQAVSSIATCSSTTVTALNGLLTSSHDERRGADNVKPVPTQTGKPARANTKSKSTAASRSKAKASVVVLEVSDERPAPLSPREKFTLATEVINAALKTLTGAIKSPPQLGRSSSSSQEVVTLSRSMPSGEITSGCASGPRQPLQSRHLNRVSSSPRPASRLSCASTISVSTPPGILAVAQCARLGFACLRSLQAKRLTAAEMPIGPLETGMSALIGKCIALGLDELAIKELRLLKRRLESLACKPPTGGPPAPDVADKNSGKPTMDNGAGKEGQVASLRSLSPTGTSWDVLDATLQDCLSALSKLGSFNECKDAQTGNAVQVLLGKISSIYWLYYLHHKDDPVTAVSSPPLRSLYRSIKATKLIRDNGVRASLLATRFERLGNVLEFHTNNRDAKSAFNESVRAHIDAGISKAVVNEARRLALNDAWDSVAESCAFRRSLTGLIRTASHEAEDDSEGLSIYDDEALDLDERGVLLEQQLRILTGMLSMTRSAIRFKSMTTVIATRLLSIYESEQYPIRRLRVILTLLRLSVDHPSAFVDDFLTRISDDAARLQSGKSFNLDHALSRYHGGLSFSTRICIAFRNEDPSHTDLIGSIMSWSQILSPCTSCSMIADIVDDTQFLLNQLTSVADYLALKGQAGPRIVTLKLITKILEFQDPSDHPLTVSVISDLGFEYLQLGYSGKAGLVLAKARDMLRRMDASSSSSLKWHLIYAEYLLTIGDPDKCVEVLEKTTSLARGSQHLQGAAKASTSVAERVKTNRLIAYANYVFSKACFEKGKLNEALAFAKRSVKLNYRAWAGIENNVKKASRNKMRGGIDSETDIASDSASAGTSLGVVEPPVLSTTHESLCGPQFWSLVPSLFQGLEHISRLFAHRGMSQEAIYYAEQGQKIVDTVQSMPLIVQNLITMGDLYVRGSHFEKGGALLEKGKDHIVNLTKSKSAIHLHCALGYLRRLQHDRTGEVLEYSRAHEVLTEISDPAFINDLGHDQASPDGIEQQMAALTLASAPTKRKIVKRGAKTATIKDSAPAMQHSTKLVPKASGAVDECSELQVIRGNLLRLKAHVEVQQRGLEQATSMLAEAEGYVKSQNGFLQQRISVTRRFLCESLEEMARDAVFCVLEESTISFPSVASVAKIGQRLITEKSPRKIDWQSPPRKVLAKVTQKKKQGSKSSDRVGFTTLLEQARETISEIVPLAIYSCSTSTLHALSSLLSSISMLLSAACGGKAKSAMHPLATVYALELSRSMAILKEKEAIQVDKASCERAGPLQWPRLDESIGSQVEAQSLPLDYGRFQKDYIDIIPKSWTAISISMSESCDELLLSKLQTGQTPFIIRLPLGRHNSRDADEEVFNFEQGRSELSHIIDLANFSAQDAGDMTRKGAKSEWWAEREALDSRLKDLLLNIENIWLGGFRGLFSTSDRHLELLSRFQRSFHNILDKHLPSRQRGRHLKAPRITFDPRILELFVGLGEASEDHDIDESLTDLLYFVVDILQFQGERNAYDEIDFDSLIIETQDALSCYHEALRAEATDTSANHMILILDKKLHTFPWESLPCLQGAPVSRLPSLGCLRERILAQRQDQAGRHLEDLYVDRSNGTYVLNPAGDLTTTQAVFEKDLGCLNTWTGLSQRSPSEEELKKALGDRDLFLYFGHGSGAQYIRSRTIKKLDRCAVALLMGCSSGALTDAGEFEPYGPPISYMHAGCPALVANLWDVTDKDIDRFSRSVLERWGLLPPSAASSAILKPKRGARAKAIAAAAANKNTDATPQRKTSLVEAVARSREECVLRYLNGAAPVVYGVPVYLA